MAVTRAARLTLNDAGAEPVFTAMTQPFYHPPAIATHGSLQDIDTTIGGVNIGWTVRIPKTGYIEKIGVYLASVGASGTAYCRIETVRAAASGGGSGTLYHADAQASLALVSPDDAAQFKQWTFSPAVPVTGGDEVAITFDKSGQSTLIGVKTVRIATSDMGFGSPTMFTQGSRGGVPSENLPYRPPIVIHYNDGSVAYVDGAWPIATRTAITYNSGTGTFDEYALKYTAPLRMSVIGMWAHFNSLAANAAFQMVAYNGTTALQTATGSVYAWYESGINGGSYIARWAEPVEMAAGDVRRFSVKPTTTNNVVLTVLTAANAAHLAGFPLGSAATLSKRLDAGAWTDEALQVPVIGLIIDRVLQ